MKTHLCFLIYGQRDWSNTGLLVGEARQSLLTEG